MSANGLLPSEADLAATFAYAGLVVLAERIAANYDTYSSTLALIRKASVEGLGETVPAVGFTASWT